MPKVTATSSHNPRTSFQFFRICFLGCDGTAHDDGRFVSPQDHGGFRVAEMGSAVILDELERRVAASDHVSGPEANGVSGMELTGPPSVRQKNFRVRPIITDPEKSFAALINADSVLGVRAPACLLKGPVLYLHVNEIPGRVGPDRRPKSAFPHPAPKTVRVPLGDAGHARDELLRDGRRKRILRGRREN